MMSDPKNRLLACLGASALLVWATTAAQSGDAKSPEDAADTPIATEMPLTDYLSAVISRGAPLYNNGMPEACAAVYATALEAAAYTGGWRMEREQRLALAYQLDLAAVVEDPSERAWAYRRMIDTLLSGEPMSMPPMADARVLYDFGDPDEARRWRVVVDGVMGGRSTGQIQQQDNTLVFEGATSLRNNGGFSSIRAPVPAGSAAGYDALRIRVMGDGRTWILGARGNSMRADSYWERFETTEGEWQTVTVPISGMVRQYFGTPIAGRLQPAAVSGVEFYIYDKQAGPFRLHIDRIEAVRLGS